MLEHKYEYCVSKKITIGADSWMALATTRDISQGIPCRSGIEIRIKNALKACRDRNTEVYLVWVRAHRDPR